ncbi:MAG: hypothetical protein AB7G93_17550 [Bdellovibrionales bacterium]
MLLITFTSLAMALGTSFAQTMKPQVLAPKPPQKITPLADDTTETPSTPVAPVTIPAVETPKTLAEQEQNKADPMKDMISKLPEMLSGAGGGSPTDPKAWNRDVDKKPANGNKKKGPSETTNWNEVNWDKYEFPKDYDFNSGGEGSGNIGNGLCTGQNVDRTQVNQKYCDLLKDILTDGKSCASQELQRIFKMQDEGKPIRDFNRFCPTYSQFERGPQRVLVFEQLLAALITQESGWNAKAKEKPWRDPATGRPMGGKGLFQIGVDDKSKDPDCAELNETTILDAKTNIKCGACIAMKLIAEDQSVGGGSGKESHGMARYFGPLRESDPQAKKRDAIIGAVSHYCVTTKGGSGGSSGTPANGSALPERQ